MMSSSLSERNREYLIFVFRRNVPARAVVFGARVTFELFV
jgi:hypothetical protein